MQSTLLKLLCRETSLILPVHLTSSIKAIQFYTVETGQVKLWTLEDSKELFLDGKFDTQHKVDRALALTDED